MQKAMPGQIVILNGTPSVFELLAVGALHALFSELPKACRGA